MSRLLSKERVRDLLLGLALLCATLALMLYPQPSMEAAKSGLALCYNGAGSLFGTPDPSFLAFGVTSFPNSETSAYSLRI